MVLSRRGGLPFLDPGDEDITEFLGLLKSDPATDVITISPVPADPPTTPQPAVRDTPPPTRPTPIPPLLVAESAEPTPIATRTARGWSYLFAIRCAFATAPHETPIPCGQMFRDPGAPSFSALRQAAWDTGWRPGFADRWACPACAQTNPEYETPFPMTIYAAGAPEARAQRLITDYLDPDGRPIIEPDGRTVVIPAEAFIRAQAEQRIFETTKARGRRRHHRKTVKGMVIP